MKAPKVSVYPISNQQKNHKHVLMCQARDMFPDMVKFTWKAENERGENVELKDEEMLEQRDEDREVKITSMLIVDKQKANINTFTCSVKHISSDEDKKLSIPKGNNNTMSCSVGSSECYLLSSRTSKILIKNVSLTAFVTILVWFVCMTASVILLLFR